MNIARGTICGVICGLVGAAVWAGVAYGTGYEIGWIAWGVGFLAGLGFAWGSQGGGMQAGVIAAAITILSILVGKYATSELYIQQEIGSEDEFIQREVENLQNDEVMISYVADEVVYEMTTRGETVDWPEGINPAYASEEGDYPPEIWAAARTEWESMTPEDRNSSRKLVEENIRQNIPAFFAEASSQSFWNSFSAMDFLFFGLAVITAFQIASRGKSAEGEGEPEMESRVGAEGE